MLNESRIDLYDWVCGVFSNVTDNLYKMKTPNELTPSDTTDGFVVVRVGDMYDDSEFPKQAYGDVRVFVTAYIPLKSRGRINKPLYKSFETKINEALDDEVENGDNEHYTILQESILSMDDIEDSNANNMYLVYVKSFIVTIH